VTDSQDLGLATAGEALVMAEAKPLRGFGGLVQRDRVLVSLASTAVVFSEVLAGQALIWSLAGRADRYSGKVQQPVRI
jgi:hypothetical protein